MMQIISKKIALFIGSALIIGVIFPAIAFGQANFCANMTARFANYYPVVQQRVANLQAKIADSQTRITTQRAQKDANLASARTLADTSKITYYANLEASATTDAEKSAVQNFETAVNNAEAAKRTAIDSATATYRTGVDAILAQKQPLIQAAAPTFEAAVKAVVDKAKTDCANGVSSATVFANAKAGLKTAIAQFKDVVQYGGMINTQMTVLKSARNAAYQKANSDYRVAVQTAANALNLAFGATVQ